MWSVEFTLIGDTDRFVIHGKMESLLACQIAMSDDIKSDWVIFDDQDRVFSQGEHYVEGHTVRAEGNGSLFS